MNFLKSMTGRSCPITGLLSLLCVGVLAQYGGTLASLLNTIAVTINLAGHERKLFNSPCATLILNVRYPFSVAILHNRE